MGQSTSQPNIPSKVRREQFEEAGFRIHIDPLHHLYPVDHEFRIFILTVWNVGLDRHRSNRVYDSNQAGKRVDGQTGTRHFKWLDGVFDGGNRVYLFCCQLHALIYRRNRSLGTPMGLFLVKIWNLSGAETYMY